ncbi:hypothetical protein C9382_07085 [Pseudomonas aylmerensis]|uniref:Uncharacterized protein n=1 Tax=Pseudomonas aylmerensis TaxID=1869229 RepID=A0A2T4G5Y0_9PSED|nr:hypothetical protein C9382_07085 [Pseudomonas aylmerensis]
MKSRSPGKPHKVRLTRPQCANPIKCGSWLACDGPTSVIQPNRGDAIAGKPGSHIRPGSHI